MDLLLHLIRQNKVDIYDIPIALIASQYIDTLAQMEARDINVAGEFLVMAATLMEIKSRLLLPAHPGLDPEGEEEAEDPRQELVDRLLEYQRFKEVADSLQDLEANRRLCFGRGMPIEVDRAGPTPLLLPETAALSLLAALRRLLEEADEAPVTSLRRERITLHIKLREITRLLQSHKDGLGFRDLFLHGGDREEIIATFLALLELLRLGRISVKQTKALGEIRVKWQQPAEVGV
jgi:segregation and condensation protein A